MYDFTKTVDKRDVSSVKHAEKLIKHWFNLEYYEDSISLWVSEMDFYMSPEIQEAMKNRIDKGILGYTMSNSEYYSSVINWFDYKYDAKIRKNWIIPSHGTIPAIRNFIRTVTDEGDGVIIQPPVYGQFDGAIKGTKRKVLNNPLIKTETGYEIDFADFEELASKEEAKAFILCNPHNPIGEVWSKEDLTKMLEIAERHDVMVFADEVHAEILRSGVTFTSAVSLGFDNVMSAVALSKAFNITGLHITTLVVKGDELRKKYTEYVGHSSGSPVDMVTVIAAYNEGRQWLKEVNEAIDSNFEFVDEYIKTNIPKLKFNKPNGTYLAWLDFSNYDIDTKELVERIAKDGKLILESGLIFGEEGKNHVRMMIATTKEVLEEALNRLKSVLDTI